MSNPGAEWRCIRATAMPLLPFNPSFWARTSLDQYAKERIAYCRLHIFAQHERQKTRAQDSLPMSLGTYQDDKAACEKEGGDDKVSASSTPRHGSFAAPGTVKRRRNPPKTNELEPSPFDPVGSSERLSSASWCLSEFTTACKAAATLSSKPPETGTC